MDKKNYTYLSTTRQTRLLTYILPKTIEIWLVV